MELVRRTEDSMEGEPAEARLNVAINRAGAVREGVVRAHACAALTPCITSDGIGQSFIRAMSSFYARRGDRDRSRETQHTSDR